MKKILLSIIAAFALMCVAITPAMADTKIGVIDLQQLLQNLPEMKAMSDDMKKELGDKQKKLIDSETVFQKDAAAFKKNVAVMSEKDKQATTQKLMGQEQALQQMQASFQQEYMAARDKQTKQVNALLEKIKGVVNKIATRDKYDLIMVNASVAYANPSMDITQAVLAEMKK